jgi:hypothetical protein
VRHALQAADGELVGGRVAGVDHLGSMLGLLKYFRQKMGKN